MVTTPPVIAGPQSGAFTVSAKADGIDSTVRFDETVTPGAVTGLQIVSGDGQSTAPYTAFPHNLRVEALNSAGTAVQGETVGFHIQGATGSTFANGAIIATAVTDEDGLAGTPQVIAGDSGTVTVLAIAEDGSSVTFHLTVTGNTHLRKNPVTGAPRS